MLLLDAAAAVSDAADQMSAVASPSAVQHALRALASLEDGTPLGPLYEDGAVHVASVGEFRRRLLEGRSPPEEVGLHVFAAVIRRRRRAGRTAAS